MQTTGPTPLEVSLQKARCVRLALILGTSCLLLFLVVVGALVTDITDNYYKLFGYSIVITGLFLILVIMRDPKHTVRHLREGTQREGGSFTSLHLQDRENMPYSSGPPTYSELLAGDLLTSQQNASGVLASTLRQPEAPKDEPVAPPPSYEFSIGGNRDRIHSVCEVIPPIRHHDSRRTLDIVDSSVFPTGGVGDDEGLPSYQDAVSLMVDQEEQPSHDRQNLIM